jgi:hypothetical protein
MAHFFYLGEKAMESAPNGATSASLKSGSSCFDVRMGIVQE